MADATLAESIKSSGVEMVQAHPSRHLHGQHTCKIHFCRSSTVLPISRAAACKLPLGHISITRKTRAFIYEEQGVRGWAALKTRPERRRVQ